MIKCSRFCLLLFVVLTITGCFDNPTKESAQVKVEETSASAVKNTSPTPHGAPEVSKSAPVIPSTPEPALPAAVQTPELRDASRLEAMKAYRQQRPIAQPK